MRALGIAGTAKNTGKTTTTAALIEEIKKNSLSLGLTSIGFDGEEIDNITGLPKPRLKVKKGCILAVAENCLKVSSAEIDILENSQIKTPLGKIVFGKVTQEGLIVIAGPNKSSDLHVALDKFKKMECDMVIVDGALNRLSPMGEVDGLIIATGAAKTPDIDQLVEETQQLVKIFKIDQSEERIDWPNCVTININGKKTILNFKSLIDRSSLEEIKGILKKGAGYIYIPGLISQTYFAELLKLENIKNKTLVCKNAIKFLLGGNLQEVVSNLKQVKKAGLNLQVIKKIPVLAVTINPFYPAYRYNNKYSAEFVDEEVLYKKMVQALDVPVYNVMEPNHKNELFKTVYNKLFVCN